MREMRVEGGRGQHVPGNEDLHELLLRCRGCQLPAS